VEGHMRRRHGGMGLGLAIARGLVQLHNGHIWAESKGENQGTTIHVTLPRYSGS
jgi:signal transduction histidine kinase